MGSCGSGPPRSATSLPPVFAYWRALGGRYVTALCTRPDVEDRRAQTPPPSEDDLEALASAAPAMPGARVPDGRGASRALGRARRRLLRRARRVGSHGSGLPQGFEPRLERGRAGALQPRREPQGRAGALRLPGHLHHAALGARPGPAPAARPGAARVRGRGQQGAPPLAAAAGAAGGRALRVAQADGRRGRDLPSAALVAPGGVPLPRRRPRAGARRRRGAHARDLEGGPPAAPAGDGHRRRTRRRPGSARTRCSTSAWRSRSTASG